LQFFAGARWERDHSRFDNQNGRALLVLELRVVSGYFRARFGHYIRLVHKQHGDGYD
jgi:hypothetical protein